MPPWANLHGSFAFGLALAGALALDAVWQSRQRMKALWTWGRFVAVAVASALLTPFGVAGLQFPFHLSATQGLVHIGEWRPTDVSHLSPFLIGVLVLMGAGLAGRLRVPLPRLLLVQLLIFLALAHARHQILAGVCVPLLLAPALAKATPAEDDKSSPLLAVLAVVLIVICALARVMVPVARGNDPRWPATALAHVPRLVRETPVLNDYSYGGFLIWNGIRPFIDSRADLYGDIFLRDYATIVQPDPDALAATLAFTMCAGRSFRRARRWYG